RPSLEAKIILLKTLGISEEKFFSEPDLEVSQHKRDVYFRRLDQRKKGKPLAYITGSKEFWSLDFKVGQGVLIPRPETEVLVEKALSLYSGKKGMVVDVGTGCGNVAVALAKEQPESEMVGIDISFQAVSYARKNALVHDTQNVWFVVGDLFEPLRKSVMKKESQIIVSNPPYVDEKDWGTLDPQIRDYEPKQALVSGQEGYAFIKRLIRQAPDYLMPGGYLIFEIGKGQEEKVKNFFTEKWASVRCLKDLAGIKRVFLAKLVC
ncbi:MAG TPA: peptide chain release factor N(5)-glutamine methyltransferase, partial [Acidobacteriota bacterium]|nr:peptide chain release factor N(5)-glutamine methyltransferase [Acidobacteriota bacterium]